ncbi:MAG: nuclease-related domain-containing protein [Ilumatobacter sp.]|uniref:hypothetical protein n=1 Tax=Ilumatobacter sp. TaxID=1967498 RepID=UPI003C744619
MLQPTVLIPFVLSVAVLVGFAVWYRQKIKDLRLDSEDRPIPGARLTAERLRKLSSPPWRVVFEIGEKHLGTIDHIVVGPVGVLAIETIALDRPTGDTVVAEAQLVANAAIARGGVDDLAARVGGRCKTLVRVYWGTPQPDLPAGIELVPGLIAVDGQRLNDWLVALPPGPLEASQVDQIWQAASTGIGRPDPLG